VVRVPKRPSEPNRYCAVRAGLDGFQLQSTRQELSSGLIVISVCRIASRMLHRQPIDVNEQYGQPLAQSESYAFEIF
jgi:hypothetical protein